MLLYLSFAGFSLGIALQQSLLFLFALVQIGFAVFRGAKPASLFGSGRRAAVGLALLLLLSAVVANNSYPSGDPTRIHWALMVFWVIPFALVDEIQWDSLHRMLLWVSVPGLVVSLAWLLQPDEIAYSLKVGFSHFPRAKGLVSNQITNAEGLVVFACWSLARLDSKLSPRERKWIWTHLILSIFIVAFSRVRSGIIGFAVLFFLHGMLTPHFRKRSLGAMFATLSLFAAVTSVFGFNIASLNERIVYIQGSLELFAQNPIFGIGPNKYNITLENGLRLVEHPHNTLLGIATEGGVLGLCGYLVFMAVLFFQLKALCQAHQASGGPLAWVTRALLYVFLIYHTFGLFDFNFADTELLILHSLHWALIAGLAAKLRIPHPPVQNS